MKKIEHSWTHEHVYGVRIFRSELEHIIHSFVERSLTPTFTDSQFSYDSVDELERQRGHQPLELKLSANKKEDGFRSDISLHFEKADVHLHASGSSDLRSFAYELKSFLESKVPWDYKLLNPWIWGLATTLLLQVLALLLPKDTTVDSLPAWYYWPIALGFSLWIASVLHRRWNFGINLQQKHQAVFLRRNRDQILLIILGSILGSSLTVLIQWLFK